MFWDKSALEHDAQQWTNDTVFNWSEIGRKYNIRDKSGKLAKNCGQVSKDYLFNKMMEGFVFTFKGKDETRHNQKKVKTSF